MLRGFSRRDLFRLASAGALDCAANKFLVAQTPAAEPPPVATPPDPAILPPMTPVVPINRRSTVFLLRGDDRRKMVYDALVGIDAEIRAGLKRKKSVLIKPNFTNVTNQLASTHADTIRAILDYLGPRFKGPIVIAEASAGDTLRGYENFKYTALLKEYASQKVSLVDLNGEGLYERVGIITYDVHPTMVRMAKRLVDPDTFVINPCIPKTHDSLVMTGAVKNMVIGSLLHSGGKESPSWSDKRKMHQGPNQMNYNMMLVAAKLAPAWGATVLDGYETMEGNGPVSGTAVPHRIALASTDYVAADRVATELMGMDPNWIGYLRYCEQFGIGNYDIAKIDVRGETIAALKRTYRLHQQINAQLQWLGKVSDPAATGGRRTGASSGMGSEMPGWVNPNRANPPAPTAPTPAR